MEHSYNVRPAKRGGMLDPETLKKAVMAATRWFLDRVTRLEMHDDSYDDAPVLVWLTYKEMRLFASLLDGRDDAESRVLREQFQAQIDSISQAIERMESDP
jgi:hypothetical protein